MNKPSQGFRKFDERDEREKENRKYYRLFDYEPAHFVVVDQYTSYPLRSALLRWIENDLSSSNKLWKFIYMHLDGQREGTVNLKKHLVTV